MKTFVIGDIHGRLEALKQVLKESNFNYNEDTLIVLGDIVDGGYNTFEVVEELLKIKNLIFIIGNHDIWFMNHISSGWAEDIWIHQGGLNTLKSYQGKRDNGYNIPVTHQDFFNKGLYYFILGDKLFVHAGFDPHKKISDNTIEYLTWDRSIIDKFKNSVKTDFKEVYIGHTSTQYIMNDVDWVKPVCIESPTTDLWCLDTGAGWNGVLTIMDINTKQYWQSNLQKPAVIN